MHQLRLNKTANTRFCVRNWGHRNSNAVRTSSQNHDRSVIYRVYTASLDGCQRSTLRSCSALHPDLSTHRELFQAGRPVYVQHRTLRQHLPDPTGEMSDLPNVVVWVARGSARDTTPVRRPKQDGHASGYEIANGQPIRKATSRIHWLGRERTKTRRRKGGKRLHFHPVNGSLGCGEVYLQTDSLSK